MVARYNPAMEEDYRTNGNGEWVKYSDYEELEMMGYRQIIN